MAAAAAAANSMNSLNSLNSITSLINAERLPNEQFLGLNPQEASILNFLRVDAQERQRDKRYVLFFLNSLHFNVIKFDFYEADLQHLVSPVPSAANACVPRKI